ncbi:hypothetical protein EDC04DRAFT_2609777 [Pisolithus marmoratus]|nr:hypothetical protein EDC04DRAFT_2609777 [Pisolithus marmoratus]
MTQEYWTLEGPRALTAGLITLFTQGDEIALGGKPPKTNTKVTHDSVWERFFDWSVQPGRIPTAGRPRQVQLFGKQRKLGGQSSRFQKNLLVGYFLSVAGFFLWTYPSCRQRKVVTNGRHRKYLPEEDKKHDLDESQEICLTPTKDRRHKHMHKTSDMITARFGDLAGLISIATQLECYQKKTSTRTCYAWRGKDTCLLPARLDLRYYGVVFNEMDTTHLARPYDYRNDIVLVHQVLQMSQGSDTFREGVHGGTHMGMV